MIGPEDTGQVDLQASVCYMNVCMLSALHNTFDCISSVRVLLGNYFKRVCQLGMGTGNPFKPA